MKKRIAALLCAALMLFASGCAAKEAEIPAETTAAVSGPQPGSTETFSNRIRSEGYDPLMLPADFPRTLPDGAVPISTVHFFRDDKSFDYAGDFTRVRLHCTAEFIAAFDDALNKNGWSGASVYYYEEEPTKEQEHADGWFEGYWRKGSTAVVIDRDGFYYDPVTENAPYTVSIDVVDTPAPFPEELKKYVPAFNGVRAGRGTAEAYNKNGEKVDAPDNTEGYRWIRELSGYGCFIGVSRAEALAYINGTLAGAGFDCEIKNGENRYGKYLLAAGTANVGGENIYVEAFYPEYLSTFSLTVTNDYDFFSSIRDNKV